MADEWEETLMVVEMPQNCEVSRYPKKESCIEILGLASEEPMVKLHNQLFSGEYRDPMGSKLVLEIEEETVSEKSEKSEENFKIKVKDALVVNKTLKLDRVYLKPKENGKEPEASSSAEKS